MPSNIQLVKSYGSVVKCMEYKNQKKIDKYDKFRRMIITNLPLITHNVRKSSTLLFVT